MSNESLRDILSVEAPLNGEKIVSFAGDQLPGVLEWFGSMSGRCKVYEHVGAVLVDSYKGLYTKNPLRKPFFRKSYAFIRKCVCCQKPCEAIICCGICCICLGPFVLYEFFQYVSTLIALVLFWAAEKGGKDTQYPTRADIIVSYILLLGAIIVLDVSSTTISVFSMYSQKLPAAWRSKKQWSEEIAQYNMMKRHVVVCKTLTGHDGIHTPVDRAAIGCLGCRVT